MKKLATILISIFIIVLFVATVEEDRYDAFVDGSLRTISVSGELISQTNSVIYLFKVRQSTRGFIYPIITSSGSILQIVENVRMNPANFTNYSFLTNYPILTTNTYVTNDRFGTNTSISGIPFYTTNDTYVTNDCTTSAVAYLTNDFYATNDRFATNAYYVTNSCTNVSGYPVTNACYITNDRHFTNDCYVTNFSYSASNGAQITNEF